MAIKRSHTVRSLKIAWLSKATEKISAFLVLWQNVHFPSMANRAIRTPLGWQIRQFRASADSKTGNFAPPGKGTSLIANSPRDKGFMDYTDGGFARDIDLLKKLKEELTIARSIYLHGARWSWVFPLGPMSFQEGTGDSPVCFTTGGCLRHYRPLKRHAQTKDRDSSHPDQDGHSRYAAEPGVFFRFPHPPPRFAKRLL